MRTSIQKTIEPKRTKSFFNSYIKVSINEVALMGILLAAFVLIKYLFFIILKGPLNFGVELLFWIISGVLFGPIKGSFFSIVCDTIIATFTTGIAFWMIEYAIIPPLVSIIAWGFFKFYKEKSIITIAYSCSTIFLMLVLAIIIFSFQFFHKTFKYEGIKNFSETGAYVLISLLTISIFLFTSFCLLMYRKRKDWKYIKWIYYLSLIVTIIVIFRWVWGPYAYIAYSYRFYSKNINFAKQYALVLFGIVTKSCLSIPLSTIIMIPLLNVINHLEKNNSKFNKYY